MDFSSFMGVEDFNNSNNNNMFSEISNESNVNQQLSEQTKQEEISNLLEQLEIPKQVNNNQNQNQNQHNHNTNHQNENEQHNHNTNHQDQIQNEFKPNVENFMQHKPKLQPVFNNLKNNNQMNYEPFNLNPIQNKFNGMNTPIDNFNSYKKINNMIEAYKNKNENKNNDNQHEEENKENKDVKETFSDANKTVSLKLGLLGLIIALSVACALAWNEVARYYIGRSIKFYNGNPMYYVFYAGGVTLVTIAVYLFAMNK